MDPASLFETYERAYCELATSVANEVRQLGQLAVQQPEQCRLKIQQIQGKLKEAEQTLQRLDMEARSSQDGEKLGTVKGYKKDIQQLMREVKQATNMMRGSQESRAELGLGESYYETSAGQRDRLLTTTERLHKTGEKIQDGRRQLLETEAAGIATLEELQKQRQQIESSSRRIEETQASLGQTEKILQQEIGISVLSDLQRQRENIMHSRDTISQIDANIGKARQVLASMSRRITQNKLIMYGVILLLVSAIALILWTKLAQ